MLCFLFILLLLFILFIIITLDIKQNHKINGFHMSKKNLIAFKL